MMLLHIPKKEQVFSGFYWLNGSLSRYNTHNEVDYTIDIIPKTVNRLRNLFPSVPN